MLSATTNRHFSLLLSVPVQPQPPKLPKQQTTRSTSQAQNPSPFVPFSNSPKVSPVSPSIVANRYLVSTIPKPNYQRPQRQQSYSSTLATLPYKAPSPYTVEVQTLLKFHKKMEQSTQSRTSFQI